MPPLSGKRLLMFVGNDYEDLELQYPKYRLREADAEVIIAGIESAGTTYHGKYGYPQVSDAALDNLDPATFDGLIIPGGWMPDRLRRFDIVKNITRHFNDAGKCVASICHGPWIDISAGIVRDATYTSTPGIKDDLINAGATWVDQAVCIDRHHVTSRRPDDLPAFCQGILTVMAADAS